MNRFQFVADHQRRYGVKRLCIILGIARASFYYWRRTAADRATRQAVDARLAPALPSRPLAERGERRGTTGGSRARTRAPSSLDGHAVTQGGLSPHCV
ncbi:hypothetical protein ACFV8E_35370 [Streptomyces sp. NPDC059849]|uniref:hypothetical protein n=1 Tax=Streptomyces sp. NPDC059849 TaxID=3346969 RepID=UPI00365534AF